MKKSQRTSEPTASLEDARVLLATGGVGGAHLYKCGGGHDAGHLFLTLQFDASSQGAAPCGAALVGCSYVLELSEGGVAIPVRATHDDNGVTHVRLLLRAADGQSIDHTGVVAVQIHHPALPEPRRITLLTAK